MIYIFFTVYSPFERSNMFIYKFLNLIKKTIAPFKKFGY